MDIIISLAATAWIILIPLGYLLIYKFGWKYYPLMEIGLLSACFTAYFACSKLFAATIDHGYTDIGIGALVVFIAAVILIHLGTILTIKYNIKHADLSKEY